MHVKLIQVLILLLLCGTLQLRNYEFELETITEEF